MPGKPKRQASDSAPQREAETAALARLARKLHLPQLQPNQQITIGGGFVSLDGFHCDPHSVTLVEVNARVGKMKTATRNKVLKDAFKMLVVSKFKAQTWRGKKVRRVLAFVDQNALETFGPKSWARAAFKKMGITTLVCNLTPMEKKALQAAQHRQDLLS